VTALAPPPLTDCPFCFRKRAVHQGLVFEWQVGAPVYRRTCPWCGATWSPCEARVVPVGETRKRQCSEPATESHGSHYLCRKHLRRAQKFTWRP
jgi:hypothetical protein